MDYGKKEETMLPQVPLNAADDLSAVGISDPVGDNADSERPFDAKRAGKEIRAVVQFTGGIQNSILCLLGHGP